MKVNDMMFWIGEFPWGWLEHAPRSIVVGLQIKSFGFSVHLAIWKFSWYLGYRTRASVFPSGWFFHKYIWRKA